MSDIFTENRKTLELLERAELTTRIKLVGIIMGGAILIAVGMRWL